MEVAGAWLQIDPSGLIVHYGTSIPAEARNARYTRVNNGDYIRFGDGLASLSMGPLGNSRDVVAHELGHAIARWYFSPAGGAISDSQSGAIDEAFGDVVASFVDTYKRGGLPNDPATWIIAEVYTNDPDNVRPLFDRRTRVDTRDHRVAAQTGCPDRQRRSS